MMQSHPNCCNDNCNQGRDCPVRAGTHKPAEALHQISEPAPVLAAPRLNDAWKARLLDGQQLELDKHGFGFHPALPEFDESVKSSDFFAALGIELNASMAENEMDSDAYEAMTDPDAELYDCRAWTPAQPDGEGWKLVAIFDTEDGPACWWMRDKPFVPQRHEGHRERTDNAAVEVLAMNMKAKLAIQRGKGYRGWNNDCTQQHLSDLLRQCVDKGDPVDVANFCAFLLARGEFIAPLAAPQQAAAPVVLPEPDAYVNPSDLSMLARKEPAPKNKAWMFYTPHPELIGVYSVHTLRALLATGGQAQADLSSVIAWLEGGCDPKHAAAELRLIAGKAAPQQADARDALDQSGWVSVDDALPEHAISEVLILQMYFEADGTARMHDKEDPALGYLYNIAKGHCHQDGSVPRWSGRSGDDFGLLFRGGWRVAAWRHIHPASNYVGHIAAIAAAKGE